MSDTRISDRDLDDLYQTISELRSQVLAYELVLSMAYMMLDTLPDWTEDKWLLLKQQIKRALDAYGEGEG